MSALDGYRSSTYDGAVAPDGARPVMDAVIDGRLEPRHVDLRPFVLMSGPDDVEVLPCGITRIALDEGALVVNATQNGGAKDTWVLP